MKLSSCRITRYIKLEKNECDTISKKEKKFSMTLCVKKNEEI